MHKEIAKSYRNLNAEQSAKEKNAQPSSLHTNLL